MSRELPFKVSASAVKRVKDPLPAPTKCNCCGHNDILLLNNAHIYYGRSIGDFPWIYICSACGSYVGLHPNTDIPLGTLADEQTRKARVYVKDFFHRWMKVHGLRRSEAYKALSVRTGIRKAECHFGMFNIDRCNRVLEEINEEATGVLRYKVDMPGQDEPHHFKARSDMDAYDFAYAVTDKCVIGFRKLNAFSHWVKLEN